MLFEKQQYQEDCVNNIVSILDKCDVFNNDYSNIKKAIYEHYKNQKYSQFKSVHKNQIDILMETGTGKTFTYIKTIFEINKQFGKTMFIIVLPRTAIKQGVIQNIKLTDEFFYNEYGKHLKYIDYTGKDSISAVEQNFIRNDSDLTVMVTTSSAFNTSSTSKKQNVIHRNSETLFEFDGGIEKYRIISSIYDFIESNSDKLSFINQERLDEIQKLFKSSKPMVEDRNKNSEKIKIRQAQANKFKELWEAINRKSNIVYQDIQENEIIFQISANFDKENISIVKTKVITKVYDVQKDKIITKEEQSLGKVSFFDKNSLSQFVFEFSKKENLPLNFVLKLFSRLDKQKIKNNPSKAISFIKRQISDVVHSSILQCVDYSFAQTNIYSKNILQNDDGNFIKEIEYTQLGRNLGGEAREEFLYDRIIWDSDIERKSMEDDPISINAQNITVFAKLPSISIPTPYKSYNPDFAYLIDRGNEKKQLFLVVETKGYRNEGDIPKAEQSKIDYAKKFFQALQQQLPSVDIRFETRVNKQSLSDILQRCS